MATTPRHNAVGLRQARLRRGLSLAIDQVAANGLAAEVEADGHRFTATPRPLATGPPLHCKSTSAVCRSPRPAWWMAMRGSPQVDCRHRAKRLHVLGTTPQTHRSPRCPPTAVKPSNVLERAADVPRPFPLAYCRMAKARYRSEAAPPASAAAGASRWPPAVRLRHKPPASVGNAQPRCGPRSIVASAIVNAWRETRPDGPWARGTPPQPFPPLPK